MNFSKWARRGLSALVAVMVPASLVAANPALAAGKGGGSKPGGSATTFVGRATGIAGTLLGGPIVLSDAVLPRKGGMVQNSALTLRAAGSTLGLAANLATDVAHVATIGQLQRVDSEASLADVNLDLVNALGINLLHLDAGLLMSKVWGECDLLGVPHLGGWFNPAQVNLHVLGLKVDLAVTGGNNQKILDLDVLGLGRVVIVLNELTQHDGVITANALHVTVTSLVSGVLTKTVDLVLSGAKAGLKCGLAVPKKGDFITGGGWIMKDGHKANFAIAGGKKTDGTCWWGHLLFNDKQGNVVKANGLTGCNVLANLGDLSTFDGLADPHTFVARAADHGEPGSDDRFGLKHGNLELIDPLGDGVDTIDGGNIQLHTPKA
jgi:hypothetical protein